MRAIIGATVKRRAGGMAVGEVRGGDNDGYGNWLVKSLRLKPTAFTCVKGRPETWGEELVRQDFKFWQHTC